MTWLRRHLRVGQAVFYLAILATWEILPRAGVVPRLFVPPLSEALGALVINYREYLSSLPTTFGEILVAKGFVSEVDIARTLVKQSGLPYIDASKYRINKDGVQAVPAELMWLNQFVVLDQNNNPIPCPPGVGNTCAPVPYGTLDRTNTNSITVGASGR